jgi:beta-mannosidase
MNEPKNVDRRNFSLDGIWKFRKDPEHKGEQEGYYRSDLKDEGWENIKVPSHWQLEGKGDYNDVAWYRTKFILKDKNSDQAIRLVFRGVDYYTSVWLNNQYVGEHEGYFSPFDFEVTDILIEGENTLAVKVNCPTEADTVYKTMIDSMHSYWDHKPASLNPAGIWNSVMIKFSGRIYLKNIAVGTKILSGEEAEVLIDLSCKNTSKDKMKITYDIEINPATFRDRQTYKKTVENVVETGECMQNFKLQIRNPKLWWSWDMGEPNLYSLKVTISYDGNVLDLWEDKFGIREVSGGANWELYLNGKRLFGRGLNYISDLFLSKVDRDTYSNHLRLIKDMNVNMIHPFACIERPEFYDLCDERGILIQQDFPLLWGYSDSDEFTNKATLILKEMIDLLRNHPSIMIWTCHNETVPWNLRKLDKILNDEIKTMDPTRITAVGSVGYEPELFLYHPQELNTDLKQAVKKLDHHTYDGIFGGSVEWLEERKEPFISEYGGGVLMPNSETLREHLKPEDLWPPNWSSWMINALMGVPDDPSIRSKDSPIPSPSATLGWNKAAIIRGLWYNAIYMEEGELIFPKTLEEYIYQTQLAWIRHVKRFIETFRKKKYMPTNGLSLFMFKDVHTTPIITCALMDYYARAKGETYNVVRQAYQPLHILLDWPQARYRPGQYFSENIYVVNDWRQSYEGLNVKWSISAPDGSPLTEGKTEIQVPEDSVVNVGKVVWKVPDGCRGTFTINLAIKKNEELLSHNEYSFNVTLNDPSE